MVNTCPYCSAEVDYLYASWEHHDYESEFHAECETCHRLMTVNVVMLPEFITERTVCCKCQKVETPACDAYCGACSEELKRLSDWNKERSK